MTATPPINHFEILQEQVPFARWGISELSPLTVVAELQGHKQLLAHGPALAGPLSGESTRAHPAATGIWGVLRRVSGAQLPGKQWDSRLG